jgi:hypothetical protein
MKRIRTGDVAGMLITDGQKRRAKTPAERRAIAKRLDDEERAIDAFLANLSPEQRAEMARDCEEEQS